MFVVIHADGIADLPEPVLAFNAIAKLAKMHDEKCAEADHVDDQNGNSNYDGEDAQTPAADPAIGAIDFAQADEADKECR